MENKIKQKKSNCLRVVLYGPESSGKTTLANELAKHYKTVFVPEFARNYLQEKWNLTQEVCDIEDLDKIVIGQIESENKALENANRVLLCDTNVLVTKVWSEIYFDGFSSAKIKKWSQDFIYDLYILTQIDIPWKKDDLRDSPNNRKEMFNSFKLELDKNKFKYLIVNETKKERINKAIKFIDSILDKV